MSDNITGDDQERQPFLSSRNAYFIIISVIGLSLSMAVLKHISDSHPEGPTIVESFFLNFMEPIIVGICVALIFMFFQYKFKGDEIDQRLSKYEDVFAAAELLQNSRKNNGLAGIVESPEEENIFDRLSQKDYPKEKAPKIWWLNFRIEKYDTFKRSIEKFVGKGGEVYLITNHHENPNIDFRRSEAYIDKSIEDYRQHFILQARTFINLEKLLNGQRGKFRVYFNKESTGIPIFIVSQDLDYAAYTGFYLNDISGHLPYVFWETAGEGMVKKFIEFINYKIETSVSAQDMAKHPDISTTIEDESERGSDSPAR